MTYTLIETDDPSGLMPEGLYTAEKDKNLYIFAALEKKTVLSHVVFSIRRGENQARLIYLYTQPQQQRRGLAAGLLDYAEDRLKAAGIKSIRAVFTQSVDRAEGLINFMENIGYDLQAEPLYILSYNKCIYDNKLTDFYEKNRKQLPGQQALESAEDIRLKMLMAYMREESGYDISLNRIWLKACYIHMENGEVKAGSLVKRYKDTALLQYVYCPEERNLLMTTILGYFVECCKSEGIEQVQFCADTLTDRDFIRHITCREDQQLLSFEYARFV